MRPPGCRMTAQVSLSPAKGAMAFLPFPLYQAPWQPPQLQLQQRVLQSKPAGFYSSFISNTRCHWHTLNTVCWKWLRSACSAPHPNAEAFVVPAAHWQRPHKSSSDQVWRCFQCPRFPDYVFAWEAARTSVFTTSGFSCVCVFSLVSDKDISTGKR